ncbi:MAG: PqqD family protein [Deltaproteobacteria bacterium]|nr:PqqD family protein [Deltaproteobacteria bacterium]MBM4287010.1 PqqD family protein [Deltaproteobacteria bacterium]
MISGKCASPDHNSQKGDSSGGTLLYEPACHSPRSPDAAFRILGEEAVILHLRSGVYYSLDEVGAAIWSLLDGRRSLAEIVAAICQEYEVDAPTAAADLDEFIQDLLTEELVQFHES